MAKVGVLAISGDFTLNNITCSVLIASISNCCGIWYNFDNLMLDIDPVVCSCSITQI